MDHFFRNYLNGFDKYKDLWKSMISVLANGKDPIERSLSVDKKMLMKDLEAYFLCAECLGYDLLKPPAKKCITCRSDTKFYCKSALCKYEHAFHEN